jgi:autotransporter-associated beta strand protein
MTRVLALLSLISLLAFNAAGAVHVWTGASSDRVSDAANWRGGSPAGDAQAELSFPTTSLHLDVVNDLQGLTIRVIDFSGLGYRIAGNALTLVNGAQILDSANAGNEIGCDLQLAGGVTFRVEANPSPGTGAFVSGGITGIGPLLKEGPGTLTFSGLRANTYEDETRVADGTLRLQKDPDVDAVPGDVAVGPGGAEPTLMTLADEQIPDHATIRLSSQATLRAMGIETIGPMSLGGSTDVETALGILVLAGDITLLPGATTRFSGGFALPVTRTITCDHCNSARFSLLGEVVPGAGLVLRGTQPAGGSITVEGSYRGAREDQHARRFASELVHYRRAPDPEIRLGADRRRRIAGARQCRPQRDRHRLAATRIATRARSHQWARSDSREVQPGSAGRHSRQSLPHLLRRRRRQRHRVPR